MSLIIEVARTIALFIIHYPALGVILLFFLMWIALDIITKKYPAGY